ncbi:MAG TPA: response regulator [Polyangiales bacterium]|nr:response regulator [Polyangiales bacterium]
MVFIVAAAGLSLVTLTVTGSLVALRVEHQLSLIQRRYVPKLELGPKLESGFERITRSLQDAVAAQDLASLDESARLKNALSLQLSGAQTALDAQDVESARQALDEYYSLAHDVSRRLIAAETGEELVSLMSLMQAKQAEALDRLRKATAFDRNELSAAFAAVSRTELEASRIRLFVSFACLLVVSLLSYWLSGGILRALTGLAAGFERFGRGEFSQPIVLQARDELSELAERANQMARSLERLNAERDRSDWLKEGQARLMHELRGELEPRVVAERAISVLARYLDAKVGALYYEGPDGLFRRLGQYAATPEDDCSHQQQTFNVGEGPAGEAATRSQLSVCSSPRRVLLPLVQMGHVAGVLELSCSASWSEQHNELLLSVRESIAIAMEVARARVALEQKNIELDATRQVLEKNAAELTTVSAYKTQFLANMSHELRTPLNSMLLLSNLLAANDGHNLSAKQVEYCRTIHGAGKDLLALINQVLDLAKIEAGKQQVQLEEVPLQRWADHAEHIFGPVARDKGLEFKVELAPSCPTSITTDGRRVEQILNNLLGNALKFTLHGTVSLRIAACSGEIRYQRADLLPESTLELTVSDTGVGIAAEHLERIFAPFEQADASQERRFGGTGLGLTIARELATLLGGELSVSSVLGQGTTFVFYIPYAPPKSDALPAALGPRSDAVVQPTAAAEPDLGPVLIVEDESHHAQSLGDLLQSAQFEVRSVTSAREALAALDEQPFRCVVLDLGLPDMDGLELVELLSQRSNTDRLPVIVYTGRALSKAESLRLQSCSQAVVLKGGAGAERVVEEIRNVSQRLKAGLRPSLRAPIPSAPSPRLDGRLVLLADDDMRTVYALSALLRAKGAEVLVADNGITALSTLAAQPLVDIVLLDIMMPEMDGYETLRRLRAEARWAKLPVIALTAKAGQHDRQTCLDRGATGYMVKPVDGEKLIELMHQCLIDSQPSAAESIRSA